MNRLTLRLISRLNRWTRSNGSILNITHFLTIDQGTIDDQHNNEETRITYEQQRSQHCRDPDQHWVVADSSDRCSSRRNFDTEDYNRGTFPSLLDTEQNIHRARSSNHQSWDLRQPWIHASLDCHAHDDLHVSFALEHEIKVLADQCLA